MRWRSVVGWSALVLVIGGGAVLLAAKRSAGRSARPELRAAQDEAPVAEVQRGDVNMDVHATGELRASHTMMLTAPSVGGGSLEITQLLPTSTPVKKGDVVVEFDPGEQQYKLDQSRSELMQAEQEITKANADAAVLAAQDKVAALKARYDVRQAELDVQKNEIVSSIDGKKNNLALEQAQRVQTQMQQDMQSHQQSGQAAIYLAKEKYNKAKLAMDEAQRNIDKMRVTAPMDGMVSIQRNPPQDFYFTGMAVPDFHAGDLANPGSAIAQIVDSLGLELSCKLGERSSSSVTAGEPVEVVFDAMPGRTFHGKVKTVGGMSRSDFFDDSTNDGVEVTMELSDADPHLHSGFSAQILFRGDKKKNVLYLPRQALFMKDGKRFVYVDTGKGYEQRAIKIAGESESKAVIEGLGEGTRVTLVDPTAPRNSGNSGATATATGTGAP
jgi:multidrug resistance efflux pump